MKTLGMIAALLVLMSTNVFAEAQKTARVYKDYTPVRILYTVPGVNADVEASKAGLVGSFKEVSLSEIPQDRANRDSWKWDEGVIKADSTSVDTAKKLRAKKRADKEAAISKLKTVSSLSDDEIEALGLHSKGDN